ncbi:MAG: nitroreductase [Chloroflexi bacterium]|nr:MAG: nitroreductase [Chloroflexota bacterium]
MDVFEAIRTTRAMRRLDPSREVSDEDIRTIVEAATKAGSAGNRQPARWLVVRDAAKRRQLGELYRECVESLLREDQDRTKTDPAIARRLKSTWHLARHLGEAPVLILVCAPGQPYASIFVGVQNLMLAARALRLGTTLTTSHLCNEQKVKALLGIPDDVNTFGLIPVGYPLGRWGDAPRRPVEELAYRDEWGRELR